MTGKEKCKLLRQIRKEIAANNHIPYFPTECTYEGDDCVGSCPMCEAEAAYLDRELNERAASGASITVRGVSLETFKGSCPTPPLAGVMVPVDHTKYPVPSGARIKGALRPRDIRKKRDEWDVTKLGLSMRALKVLIGNEITTISGLISLSAEDLRKLEYMTKPKMDEIIEKVHRAGLYFKGEDQ